MKLSMLRVAILTVAISCLHNFSKAQSFYSDNALLYGRVMPSGSARIQSLGGAQTALGGDYSSAYSNPAGLGMFNHSEFTLSPGLNFSNTDAKYLNNAASSSNMKFNIPGLSMVIHPISPNTSGFLGGSFGVTLNRINDFNQSYLYSGTNSNSSLIDYFINNSYGSDGKPLDPSSMLYDQNNGPGENFYNISALAYNNYLTDYDSASNSYVSPLRPLAGETRSELQQERVNRSGSQYQVSVAYGGNFSDKLYLGVGVGFTTLRYNVRQSFTESNFSFSTDPNYNPLKNFTVNEGYNFRGSGINLTAGLIYRPINMIQIGASIVTPTVYQITDTYNATVNSTWNHFDYYNNGKYLDEISVAFDKPSVVTYNVKTPFRFNTGATFFIGKYGFLTSDVEFVNYSSAKYSDPNQNNDPQFIAGNNADIKSSLTPGSTINLRLGGEYRFDMFRVRAGYALYPDPYKDKSVDRKLQNFTGGIGIKKGKYSIDFTGIYSMSNNVRVPYSAGANPAIYFADPTAQLKSSNLNFIVTVGFTF
jgi:hypothetical protein